MEFKPNYPIYLQVADYVLERLLTGGWQDGGRLPAVRELSVTTSVNPNTVIKSLAFLQDHGIVTTQRGVGYFLTADAREKTLAVKKDQFFRETLPEFFAQMDLLEISLEELEAHYHDRSESK